MVPAGKRKTVRVYCAEVAVKPWVTLGEYKGLEVPKAELGSFRRRILQQTYRERGGSSKMSVQVENLEKKYGKTDNRGVSRRT